MNLYDALKAIKDNTASIYLEFEYEDTRGVMPDVIIRGYDYNLLSKETLERKVSRIGTKNDGSIVICACEEEDNDE